MGGGGGGKDHVVFRENGGRISRHQRSVKEKTDCQHTANEGNGEHCRALTGVSDKFFRGTNKILNPPPPPLEGINNDRFLIITRVSIILSTANSLEKLISNLA